MCRGRQRVMLSGAWGFRAWSRVKCFALSSTKSKHLDLGSTKITVVGYWISSKPPQQYVSAELVRSGFTDRKFSTDVWRRIFIGVTLAGTTPFSTLGTSLSSQWVLLFLFNIARDLRFGNLNIMSVIFKADSVLVPSHLWIYHSCGFVNLLPNDLK